MAIDGDGAAGPSPMQLAAFGVAGCMAADVVSILQKGRYPLAGLRVAFSGARALSHEKYCSVWHSMRQDIAFTTSFDLHP